MQQPLSRAKELGVTWPQDDSYRPHMDLRWLQVLADAVDVHGVVTGCERSFRVMRNDA